MDTLGAGPWEFPSGRGARIKVSVVTKGVNRPWGIAFLPDPSTGLGAGGLNALVTERPGRLRQIKNGVLDPTPIGPMPEMLATGLGGLLDVSLHPQFVKNRLIYLTYSKPGPGAGNATTAVMRARWDGGSTLADVKDILVADAYHGGPGSPQGLGPASGSYGSRLAWDRAGFLYVSLGDRNYPPAAQNRPRTSARSCASATMAACRRTIRSSAGRDTSPNLLAGPSQSARPLHSSGDR